MIHPNSLSRIIFVSLISMILSHHVNAQSENSQNAPAFHVGIEAYYGFPNLFSDIVENSYETDHQFRNYSLKDFGPSGIRAEFFVNKHIAFGLDANYATTQLEWVDTHYSVYDPITGQYTKTVEYNYRVDVTRLRILSRFNVHYGASKYFDWYTGAGIGYNNSQITLTTNAPNESYHQENYFPFATIPVCLRICTGGKYYPIKNLGIGFEFGLGGPILSFGLNGRF